MDITTLHHHHNHLLGLKLILMVAKCNNGSIMLHRLPIMLLRFLRSPLLLLQGHHVLHSLLLRFQRLNRHPHLCLTSAAVELRPIIQGLRIHSHHLHRIWPWVSRRAHSLMKNWQGQLMASLMLTFLDKAVLAMCIGEFFLMAKRLRLSG